MRRTGKLPPDDAIIQEVPPVTVSWKSSMDEFTGTFDHAMLIVPVGDTQHRVYFIGKTIRQLGQLTAVVLEMAGRNAHGRPLEIALQIVNTDGEGSFRGREYDDPPLS